MSKFRVNYAFALERRRLFVLAGATAEGQIQAGMIVSVPLNSSLSISGLIHSIEYARTSSGREDVCLCIAYENSGELDIWNSLNLRNETLDVLPASQSMYPSCWRSLSGNDVRFGSWLCKNAKMPEGDRRNYRRRLS